MANKKTPVKATPIKSNQPPKRNASRVKAMVAVVKSVRKKNA